VVVLSDIHYFRNIRNIKPILSSNIGGAEGTKGRTFSLIFNLNKLNNQPITE